MTLVEFLIAPANVAFAVALGVMIVLAIIEIAGLFLGFSGVDAADADADVEAPGLLGWLHFGSIPTLIFLVLGSLGFGITGYAVQALSLSTGGQLLPKWAAILIALAGMIATLRLVGGLLKRSVLREETQSKHSDDLIGMVATITLGETRRGTPTQAKLKDEFGTNHYLLVEPLSAESTYQNGQEVILIERAGPLYRVVGVHEEVDQLMDSLSAPSPNFDSGSKRESHHA